jgi:hypothetical protein
MITTPFDGRRSRENVGDAGFFFDSRLAENQLEQGISLRRAFGKLREEAGWRSAAACEFVRCPGTSGIGGGR